MYAKTIYYSNIFRGFYDKWGSNVKHKNILVLKSSFFFHVSVLFIVFKISMNSKKLHLIFYHVSFLVPPLILNLLNKTIKKE